MRMTKREAIGLLNETKSSLYEFKHSAGFRNSQDNPVYLRMLILEQALTVKVKELNETASSGSTSAGSFGAAPATRGNNMKVTTQGKDIKQGEYANTLKRSAQGEDVAEACSKMRRQGVKESLVKVCESQEKSLRFIQKIVESKKAKKRIMEGDVEEAQVVLAAQDIVDRVQKILEDMVDLQYKDIPALADNIKGEFGVDQSVQFKDSMTQSLQTLADQLATTKNEMESAVGIITGDEVGMPADLGMDDDLDLDNLAPEAENEFDSEVVDLGRERR